MPNNQGVSKSFRERIGAQRGPSAPSWGENPASAAPVSDKVLPIKPADPDPDEYQAFKLGQKPHTLRIRSAEPSRYPTYSAYLDIIFDEEKQTHFTIIYSHMVVEVEGLNLGPVVHAISTHACEAITAFDPSRHTKADTNVPHIMKVSFPTDRQRQLREPIELPW